MGSTIRVLLIEDNDADANLIRELLLEKNNHGFSFEVEYVPRLSEGLERMASGEFDTVLLDLSLPDSSGLETLARVHSFSATTPVIVVSGSLEQQIAVRALSAGAKDYFIKGLIDARLLVKAIVRQVETRPELTDEGRHAIHSRSWSAEHRNNETISTKNLLKRFK